MSRLISPRHQEVLVRADCLFTAKNVRLADLFVHKEQQFIPAGLRLYEKRTKASYYCLDLIWKPLKDKIRLVLVKMNGEEFILLCSHLHWAPQDIIRAYSFRFKLR